MLGWLISVYRLGLPALRDARGDVEEVRSLMIGATGSSAVPRPTDADTLIASWQTGLNGAGWLSELVANGQALSTRRGGYADTFLIRCRDFAARRAPGLPHEKPTWVAGAEDVVTERWLGRTTVDDQLLGECDLDTWLLVEVWDES
jgi:hypothetical protein